MKTDNFIITKIVIIYINISSHSILFRRCRCTRTTWPKSASSSLSSAATSSPSSLLTQDPSHIRLIKFTKVLPAKLITQPTIDSRVLSQGPKLTLIIADSILTHLLGQSSETGHLAHLESRNWNSVQFCIFDFLELLVIRTHPNLYLVYWPLPDSSSSIYAPSPSSSLRHWSVIYLPMDEINFNAT